MWKPWQLPLSVLLVSLSLGGAARANATLTLTPAFPTVEAGNDVNVVLAYSIQGATAGDALDVILPPDVGIAGYQVPTDNNGNTAFGGGCSNLANSRPWQSGCDFTYIGNGASSSGTIELTLRAARWAFAEGTTDVLVSATFASTSGGDSDSFTLGVTAHADLDIWGGHFSINASQLVSHQPAGFPAAVPGRMVRLTTLYYNAGTAPYIGLEHGMTLPSLAHYVGYEVGSGAPQTSLVLAPPAPPGDVVRYALGRPVGQAPAITGDGRAPFAGVEYADVVYTYYFISCDDLATAYNPDGSPLSGALVDATFAADADVPLVAGGTRPDTFGMVFGARSYVPRCTGVGSASKGHDPGGNRAAGEQISMSMNVYPPDRVPVSEVVAIDALPTNVTLVSTSGVNYSTSFQFYLCRIPASAGALISSSAFLATYRNDSAFCWLRPPASTPATNPPSWPIGETTHLALYAPTWADTSSFGGSSSTVITANVTSNVRIDFDAVEGDTVTNRLHVDNGPNDFGPFDSVDTFGIDNALDYYVALSSQQTPVHSETFNPGTAGNPTRFILAASFWRNGGLLQNPAIHVTLPKGIEPDLTFGDIAHGFVGFNFPLNCVNAPPVASLAVPAWVKDTKGTADALDDQWSITFDLDPIGTDDWYSQGCNAGDYYHTEYARVQLIPGYPFVTDQPNIATVTLDIDNPGAPPPRTTNNFSAFVRMPKEMRVTTVQGCGVGPAEPQIVAGYENSAGTNLTGVVVTVPIPKVGSPAGTEVDTVFVAMTPPTRYTGGYTQEYSTNGSDWQPIAAVAGHEADVRWVRTTLTQVDAYVRGTFGVTLRHVTPATPGDSITFIANIDSNELAPVDVLAPTEYIVGDCTAAVHVTKTFDDGTDTDAPLANWPFEARENGILVAAGVTDDEGQLTLELPPGTYELSELLPEPSQVVWTPTSQVGPSRTIVIAWEDELDVAFTNSCSCEADACATYNCVYPGVCEVAQELECNDISCDAVDGNVPDRICAAQMAVAYAIVYDAQNRPVGTVRCAQELDGSVACDEVSPGKLRVFQGLFCPGVVEVEGDVP